MKKVIAAAVLILLFAAIVTGNRFTAATLDRQLPPLLSEALGLPVTLAPIEARLTRLLARSPRLVMGDPGQPAIVATGVEVRLDWRALLSGEIRLHRATADELMANISRWPRTDDPWPADYRFLDPWLPKSLNVNSGRYVTGDDRNWPVSAFTWRRLHNGGAKLGWVHDRDANDIGLQATLNSLTDLLDLKEMRLQLSTDIPGTDPGDTAATLLMRPDPAGGYQLTATVSAAGTRARLDANSPEAYRLPAESSLEADQLDVPAFRAFLGSLQAGAGDKDLEDWLATPLPALQLPTHRGRLQIGKILVGDELIVNTVAAYHSGAGELHLDSISAQGPSGELTASARLLSQGAGWRVHADAAIAARESNVSLAPDFVNADWHWRDGQLQADASGESWGAMLDSLSGNLQLGGLHRGEVDTPVALTSKLGGKDGTFALDQLEIVLGKGRITGALGLSGGRERKLSGKLSATDLDLDFLFAERDRAPRSGVAIPTYLTSFPGVELDLAASISEPRMPGLNLASADFSITRDSDGGEAIATAISRDGGKLKIELVANQGDDDTVHTVVNTDLDSVNISGVFMREQGLIVGHSSGHIRLEGSGKSITEIFRSLEGSADLDTRFEAQRILEGDQLESGDMSFSAGSRLVLDGDRIVGIEFDRLDITSVDQDITGTLSIAAGREPWLVAELDSRQLNIDRLQAWMPQSGSSGEQAGALSLLRELDSARISLEVDSASWRDLVLSDITLAVSSMPDKIVLEQADFGFRGGTFDSRVQLAWKGEQASFEAQASVANLVLDDFVHMKPKDGGVPLSGKLELKSEGATGEEIFSRLRGKIDLRNDPQAGATDPARRRELAMTLRQVPDGVEGQLEKLAWDTSELHGSFSYLRTQPPALKVDVRGGQLDLGPWESLQSVSPAPGDEAKKSLVSRAARTSSQAVRTLFTAPARLLTGGGRDAGAGKLFSDEPLDLGLLKSNNADVSIRLDSLRTSQGLGESLDIELQLQAQKLDATMHGKLNGGAAHIQLALDGGQEIPTGSFTAEFSDVYRLAERDSFPRSGYLSLSSRGASEAELAAGLDGSAYIEFGRGPVDYGGLTFLTTDVAGSLFRALIPSAETRTPELRCAVVLAKFNEGIGITPYGYAAQTRSANLIGRLEVDLKQEQLRLEFDSRSRKGAGLSVGNVFSNTVRVQGPLTDPAIVPNTTSLLWRGWAAFATAGLSVLGESVLKRALVAPDPCGDTREAIRADVCGGEDPAAASTLLCPAPQ